MDDVETYRRICEARVWLKRGYNDKKSVEQLHAMITNARSREAADELIHEMRRQWTCRRDWIDTIQDE